MYLVILCCFLEGLWPVVQPAVRADRSACSVRLLWYNAENLFHPSDAPGATDDAYTPGGDAHWSFFRYKEKLTRLARVIVAAGKGDMPELIGLCEIEEAAVLEDLCAHPMLLAGRYAFVHREGPDHRGMEVACLYRRDCFNGLESHWYAPPVREGSSDTREVLHLSLYLHNGDTLDVFLVHLVSRYGGSGATAAYRRRQAAELMSLCEVVADRRERALLLLAGDFNDVAGSYSLLPLQSAEAGRNDFREISLTGASGSYKYRGEWMSIDRVFLFHRRVQCRASLRIPHLPGLLQSDELYRGVKPFRTYEGFRYIGGLSDHLPLLLTLVWEGG